MSFEVAMRALLSDAGRWDDTSTALSQISSDCNQLYLSAGAFSFAGGDAHTAYEEVRDFVRRLTSDGSKETDKAAQALRDVHQFYSEADENTRASMLEKWQWL